MFARQVAWVHSRLPDVPHRTNSLAIAAASVYSRADANSFACHSLSTSMLRHQQYSIDVCFDNSNPIDQTSGTDRTIYLAMCGKRKYRCSKLVTLNKEDSSYHHT